MAINPLSFTPANYGTTRSTPVAQGNGAPTPVDGFQASGQAQPAVAAAPQEMILSVTPSQLASQDFQATLATLSASGVPVQVVLVAEGTLAPEPKVASPIVPSAPPAVSVPANKAQDDLNRAQSDISQADSDLYMLAGKTWSTHVFDYGDVSHRINSGDLHEAMTYLGEAKRDLSTAQSKWNSDPDAARKAAQSACGLAQRAMNTGRHVESREESYFRMKVSESQAQAQRMRDDRDAWARGAGGGYGSYGNYGGGGGWSNGGGNW